MSQRLSVRIALALPLVFLMACQGEVTEEDLQKWTHNDIGIARIQEVVVNPVQPMATRIRALEVVVEKGLPTRIVQMIDGVPDAQEELVTGFTAELLEHVKARDEHQYDAKDALMVLQRYLDDTAFEPIRQEVAAWAFDGLTWDAKKETVKEIVEARISSGQIKDLGPNGWEGAAILVSHGFTDKMMELLATAKDPKASGLLLKALKRLHAKDGVGMHHLAAIGQTGMADGAIYLLDLYEDKDLDKDFQDIAFNTALEMIDASDSLRKDAGEIPKRLIALMDRKDAEDRWIAAVSLVRLGGPTYLAEILARFKDDGVYGGDSVDSTKSIIDLCLDLFDGGHAEASKGVFMKNLTAPNRIVRAIAIVCLKSNEAVVAQGLLARLAAPPVAAPISLAGFLGPKFTEDQLALNAIEGLKLIAEIRADATLNADEKANKALIAKFNLDAVGSAYRSQVETQFAAWRADKVAPKGETKDTPAP